MCEYVEGSKIVPGWGCCGCRTYNGLQRLECNRCGLDRHPIDVPAELSRCFRCGLGRPAGMTWTTTLDGRDVEGRCPYCGDPWPAPGALVPHDYVESETEGLCVVVYHPIADRGETIARRCGRRPEEHVHVPPADIVERKDAADGARTVFDALVSALERRRDISEKVRSERRASGLQRSEDIYRGKREAFDEAITLVNLVRAGASLAAVEGATNGN